MNDELEKQSPDSDEEMDSPFTLEGDDSPTTEPASEPSYPNQEEGGNNSETIFGLEEDGSGPEESPDEPIDVTVPAELAEGDLLEGTLLEEGTSEGEIDQEDTSDTPLIVDLEEAKKIVETLLYVSHEPLRPRDISMVFRGVENVDAKVVRKLLAELMEEYEERTIQIVEVAEGYRMCTRVDFSPWVKRFLKQERRWRLSNAGLETLAIIAYKQPITRAEVEEIRRVDCSGVVHTLLERKMIRVLGRRDVIGRPIVYGTTPQFLQHFGFKNLTDMPKPEEFDVDIDLSQEGPGGDIIPLDAEEEEEGGETPLDDEEGSALSHENGKANGHANGSSNGYTNGHVSEKEKEPVTTVPVEEKPDQEA